MSSILIPLPLDQSKINELIPQSPPFLLLDSITEFHENQLSATYTFSKNFPMLEGHFPGDPVIPGVLLCECCLQAGATFLSLKMISKGGGPIKGKAVVTRMDKIKFKQMVKPETKLTIQITFLENFDQFSLFKGSILVAGKTALTLEFLVGSA